MSEHSRGCDCFDCTSLKPVPGVEATWAAPSGAKSSAKLPAYQLVPVLTILDRLAPRFQEGATKYGEGNWRIGLDDPVWIMDRCNHGLRHYIRAVEKLRARLKGQPVDDTDDDLAAALWALTIMAEVERRLAGRD